jgi:hypothetical protein
MKTLSAATVSVITALVSILALTFHAMAPIATAAPAPAAAPAANVLVAYTYDEAAAQCLTLTFQYGPAEVDNCLQAAALSWGVAE